MSWLQSSLLHSVQQLRVFPQDSKHFVDMPLKTSVSLMMEEWRCLEKSPLNHDIVKVFIERHFNEPGSDMEVYDMADWVEEAPPIFLDNVQPEDVKDFGQAVHQLWRILYRKVSCCVRSQPDCHTLLPLPHPFVIPGDRFREIYYWDSYWIMLGLLASGHNSEAIGMLDNLLTLVKLFGHVPNGSRTYYINRSSMVAACYEATQSKELLERALPQLVRTWGYWTSGSKGITIKGSSGRSHKVSRYFADWDQPRPESYREDLDLSQREDLDLSHREDLHLSQGLDVVEARQLYRDIASAAESGWDFSSRWFEDEANLATIRTTKVVPADLNAFLYLTARHISTFARVLEDADTARTFDSHASKLKASIDDLMWSESSGSWCDLLLENPEAMTGGPRQANTTEEHATVWHARQLPGVYASNWIPLWCGCCEDGGSQALRAVASLENSGLICEAGIRTSLYETGQQWDSPNAWSPLQHMLIVGLHTFGGSRGQVMARKLASIWIKTNMRGWLASGHMHEKYDSTGAGGMAGGGGEYVPQIGFGWTNGVLLDLLRLYPDQS